MPELSEVAEALKEFGGDPQHAGPLASVLGLEPSGAPADLLAGHATPLNRFLEARFGARELYRVGGIATDTGCAGLYVALLDNWGARSSDRDRPRRRVARALVEYAVQDARHMFIMVPSALLKQREAEFVLPRSTADVRKQATAGGVISTVRALVDLQEPSRFHRELLRELAIRPGASLLDISQRWQEAFSIERVTRDFYQEYAKVRDRLAEALSVSNRDHCVVREMTKDDARAWATRQMGRILFLWFLQSKQWLGYDATGRGSPTYLLDLWAKRDQVSNGYYRGMLVPLFFEAMARRNPGDKVRNVLGYTPYLNGGLFRPNSLEDRVDEGGEVTLPDDVFAPNNEMSVLGLLSRYRFTTQESTPDDQSVDPDPELLGRVFENLYQGDARHDTGTYYTPREIVHFMCRQVLDGYLCDSTGVEQNTLDWLRQQVTEPEEVKHPLPVETEEALINALEGVRVCDPAVGSGAFLLGMMQEIVQLRWGIVYAKHHYIEPEEKDKQIAEWKRRAITWSLYGVDINPEAVDICQLRLWLSLVLDLNDPKRIDPLPNLDFRIVAGDSLVDRVADIVFTESLPRGVYQPPLELGQRVAQEEEQIDRWRREFEATQDDASRLRVLRDNIVRAQTRIVRYHLEAALSRAREEAQLRSGVGAKRKVLAEAEARVAQLERLLREHGTGGGYQKPFLWPVAFPEVFEHGGFDIVLANPPYIQQQKLSPEDQEVYKQAFPDVFAGTADILVFFYGRAIQVLSESGWLGFITSNKYMRVDYGAGLRQHLPLQIRLNRVIDFGDLPLFDANGKPVASYPAVLVGQKHPDSQENTLRVADLTHPIRSALSAVGKKANPENVRWTLEDLGGVLEASQIDGYPQVLLRRERWILEDPALVRLFERLMSQGAPLGQFVKGRMYRGVLTGLNKAFVVDQAKRDDLIAEDPGSAELIKPWLRGQDIKRWKAEWAGLYVLAIQSSGDSDVNHPWARASSESEARQIFREAYPAVHDHLSWFEEYPDPKEPSRTIGLRPRLDQGRFWWELRACAYYREFDRQKVVWGNLAVESKFGLDDAGALVSAPANMLVEAAPWLLAVMNSELLNFAYPKLTVSRGGGFQEFKIGYISAAPVVEPSPEVKSNIVTLQCRLTDCAPLDPHERERIESDIDNLVLDTYRVGATDRGLLREWAQKRRSQFSNSAEYEDGLGENDDDE